jgi:tetratricopeptide (TPR) repeat protein
METMASYQAQLELLAKKLEREYESLRTVENQMTLLKKNLSNEQKNVEVLEADGVMASFFKLMQRYEGKLEKETLEYLGAKANYERALFLESDTKRLISETELRIGKVKEELSLYAEALQAKKTAFEQLNADSVAYHDYRRYSDTEIQLNHEKVQLQEALAACESAIDTKDSALSAISSAKSYSTWDTWFGGGLILDSMKYDAIEDMKIQVEILGNQMERLEKEMADIGEKHSIEVTEIDGLTGFFDMFFDDFFSAMSVRSHLDAQQIEIDAISEPLDRLKISLIEKLNENNILLVQINDQLEILLMTDPKTLNLNI